MKKKFLIAVLLLSLIAIVALISERFFFPQPNLQVYKDCDLVQTGMTYDEVVKIMGKPASEIRESSKVKLLYLAGGIQTESGIGFEFENERLVSKNCGSVAP